MNLTAEPIAPTASSLPPTPVQHPLPPKPTNSDSIGMGGPKDAESAMHAPTAAQALAGSNRDVVANRRAIRMANMSAAEMLKAELAGLQPLKPKSSTKSTNSLPTAAKPDAANGTTAASAPAALHASLPAKPETKPHEEDVPGLGALPSLVPDADPATIPTSETLAQNDDMDTDVAPDPSVQPEDLMSVDADDGPRGVKRSLDEAEVDVEETEDPVEGDEDEDDTPASSLAMKVNADGTVEQEDTVK